MLSPDERSLYSRCLSAPDGHRFDAGVATTFTLDLETLLVLPFTLATQQDAEPQALMRDPVALLEALRATTDRLAIFHQDGRIHVPSAEQLLFGLLEDCVVPVRAFRDEGVFHAKLWVLRFESELDDGPLLRVVVLSRNLTFDRSWDTVLCLEGRPRRQRVRDSRGLAHMLSMLAGHADGDRRAMVEALAGEAGRTRFDAPEPFQGYARFHAIGLGGQPWDPQPAGHGARTLCVSPFLSASALSRAAELASGERILIAREDDMNKLPAGTLGDWECHVLSDAVELGDESDGAPAGDDDGTRDHLAPADGLHAKILAVEHGWHATWWIGSANLTAPAWSGTNVELMVELTGKRSQVGIDPFLDAGFRALLDPYVRSDRDPDQVAEEAALEAAERVRDALLRAELSLACTVEGDACDLVLQGQVHLPQAVSLHTWPVTLDEDAHRQPIAPHDGERDLSVRWEAIAPVSVTSIIAFAVTAEHEGRRATVRFARRLPATGFPADRASRIVRHIVRDRSGFFRYLRLLLADADELLAEAMSTASQSSNGHGGALGLPFEEAVLEDLVRALSRDPARLDAVDRLMADLAAAPETRELVPEDFEALWRTIQTARQGMSQ